jgi:hypothetical protein
VIERKIERETARRVRKENRSSSQWITSAIKLANRFIGTIVLRERSIPPEQGRRFKSWFGRRRRYNIPLSFLLMMTTTATMMILGPETCPRTNNDSDDSNDDDNDGDNDGDDDDDDDDDDDNDNDDDPGGNQNVPSLRQRIQYETSTNRSNRTK